MQANRPISMFILLSLILLLTACGSQTVPATPTLAVPTAVSADAGEADSGPEAAPVATSAATATAVDTAATVTPLPPTATTMPTVTSTSSPEEAPAAATGEAATVNGYRVAFVADNDTLNVRAGAGVSNAVVGQLAPDASGIAITGPGQGVAGSTWVPILAGDLSGWVNSRFLTPVLDGFCQDADSMQLLTQMREAIEAQDNGRMAALTHPERGLRVRVDWWNPEILLRGSELNTLFTSSTDFDWGVEDGSGFDIQGSFAEVVVPVLVADYLAPQPLTACNEILHGATAGLVVLPEGYDALNFYAVQRPAPEDGIGFDWGTWVVGVEQWQGEYYISYLVHYDYEI